MATLPNWYCACSDISHLDRPKHYKTENFSSQKIQTSNLSWLKVLNIDIDSFLHRSPCFHVGIAAYSATLLTETDLSEQDKDPSTT